MNDKLLSIILVLCTSALISCSTVTLSTPFKDNATIETKQSFEGKWLSGDEVIQIAFDEKGVGNIASLDWKAGKGFKIEHHLFTFHQGDEVFYGTGYDPLGKIPNAYHLFKFKVVEEKLIVWSPNVDSFIKLIGDEVFEGEVVGGKGHAAKMKVTSTEFLKFIETYEKNDLFDYENPNILTRIK